MLLFGLCSIFGCYYGGGVYHRGFAMSGASFGFLAPRFVLVAFADGVGLLCGSELDLLPLA